MGANYTTLPRIFQGDGRIDFVLPPTGCGRNGFAILRMELAREMLMGFLVKIQLTRSKTIEIGFGRKGGSKARSKVDMTGVELFSGESRGAPAVRILRKKDSWHIAAAGFVPPPDGELPQCWEDTPHQPVWEMPRNFQSTSAAIAVNSTMSSFGQASAEAIVKEMAQGLGDMKTKTHATLPTRLNLKLPAKKDDAPVPAPSSRKPTLPPPGVPVSENGRRFTIRPFAEEGFHLAASLPEFQALWLGRLFPEGRRPTASSIQVAESSLMASPLMQPAFREAKGSILVIFVRRNAIFFAGYRGGRPVLWRRCPGVRGYDAMREAIGKTLGVGEELINDVLEDSLVDPRPALEPFLHPVLQQLDLARAYLAGKHALDTDHALLLGLPYGAGHWQHMAEESLKMHLVSAKAFDGFSLGKGVDAANGHDCLVALGAAIAAAEVEQ